MSWKRIDIGQYSPKCFVSGKKMEWLLAQGTAILWGGGLDIHQSLYLTGAYFIKSQKDGRQG